MRSSLTVATLALFVAPLACGSATTAAGPTDASPTADATTAAIGPEAGFDSGGGRILVESGAADTGPDAGVGTGDGSIQGQADAPYEDHTDKGIADGSAYDGPTTTCGNITCAVPEVCCIGMLFGCPSGPNGVSCDPLPPDNWCESNPAALAPCANAFPCSDRIGCDGSVCCGTIDDAGLLKSACAATCATGDGGLQGASGHVLLCSPDSGCPDGQTCSRWALPAAVSPFSCR